MRTFVINLEKDKTRRKAMQSQLSQLDVSYEFFTGAYGIEIPDDELEMICNQKALEANFKQPIADLKGLVGCTYSHFLIYKKMVEDDISIACILEDDVIISNQFPKVLNWLEEKMSSNEVVSLHTLLYFDTNFKSTDRFHADGFGIYEPNPPKIRGTQGYVITREVAQKIMTFMMPIIDFPDCWHRYKLGIREIEIKVIFPFPLRHMWIDSVRDAKTSAIKGQLVKFIQEKRIFPIWNVLRYRRRMINDKFISSQLTVDQNEVHNLYLEDISRVFLLSTY